MRNYFRLVNSFPGHIYFEVSKHLCNPVSWVIKNKFNPDVKFLIFKYSQIARERAEQSKKLKNELS